MNAKVLLSETWELPMVLLMPDENKRAQTPRRYFRLLFCWLLLALLVANGLPAAIAGPYSPTQCAGSRFGSNLGCTANDVSLNSITIASTPPGYCVGGSTLSMDFKVTINFGSASRYDIGVFLSNNGMNPTLTSATSCSVAVLPTTSPFWGSLASGGDGDSCGDGGNNLSGSFVMANVVTPCTTDGSGNFALAIPYVITWDQSKTNICNDNTDLNPGGPSKCNAGSVTFPSGIKIVVMPDITITDGATTVPASGSTTYTIVVTNKTASTVSGAVFKDPLPANFSYSSVSCVAAGGATCPAITTANIATGVTLPNMPDNSTLTFSVTGSLGGASCGTLTNTASVTLSGQTNPASDTDNIMCGPTATKSFSPAVVASGGASTLTMTLTNPNASTDITGAAFTDNYPANMTNSATPGLTNSCGGTATAAANGTSLSLSGATIPKGANCAVTVQVKATATGTNTLAVGAVTSSNAAPNSSPISGTLYVPTAMTLVANPTTVQNGGVATITATITDAFGGAVPGDGVSLSCTGSATITTVNGVTNASGQAIFTITDPLIQLVTCTATDSFGLSQQVSVNFTSISGFNAFESTTAANAVSGPIYTKLAGTAFGLDLVAVAGTSQASGFTGNVKVELLANTGTAGSGYGTDNCPTSTTTPLQTIASTTITSGRSAVSFAAVANAYQDVRVRISYPAASPSLVVCATDSFAIRPAAVILWTDAYAGWAPVPASSPGRSDLATSIAPSASVAPTIKAGTPFTLYATTGTGSNYAGTLALDSKQLSAQTTTQSTSLQTGGVVGTLSPTSLTANSVVSGNASYSEVGYLYLAAGAYRDDSFTSVDQPADCIPNSSDDTPTSGRYGCSIGNKAVVSLGRFIPDHFALTTTGSITAGTNSLVVASNAGIAAGMTLSVAGAGTAGAALTTSVTAVSGTTVTLSASATTTVANASVVLASMRNRSDLASATSSFTYMDEPMQLTFRVIAYSSAETTTRNYAGVFAKLDATTLGTGSNWFNTGCAASSQCMGLGAASGATGLSTRLAIDTASTGSSAPSSAWNAGVGTFAAFLRFQRGVAPDGPYSALQIGGLPQDGDGVTLPASASSDTAHRVNFDATTGNTLASNPDGTNERRLLVTTDVRYGRLHLSNAFGSEKSSLQVPVQAQYWSGQSWVLNASDSLTTVLANAFALSGSLATNTSASAVTLTGGRGFLTLAQPSPMATGSVDVAVNLGTSGNDQSCLTAHGGTAASQPWLRSQNGNCAATYDRDPSARATFGIYSSEARRAIHVRELF